MTSQYELDKRRCRRMNILLAIAERHNQQKMQWYKRSGMIRVYNSHDRFYGYEPGYRSPGHAIRSSNHEFDRLMVHTPTPFDMLGLV